MRRGATPTVKAEQATIAIADHRQALAGLHSARWVFCPALAAGPLPTVALRVPQGLRQSAQAVPVTVASSTATAMGWVASNGDVQLIGDQPGRIRRRVDAHDFVVHTG